MTLYIQLQGGLGNQLFQYAAAIALGYTIQVSLIKAPIAHSGRDYRKTLYYRLLSVDESPSNVPIRPLQPFDAWKPEDWARVNDTVLQGYFQYLPAIEGVLPHLRQDLLTFLGPYREALRAKYSIQNPSSRGFIHVRRGDYLTAPPNLHWIMSPEYYMRALQNVDPKIQWYVLSDDIAWCKKQDIFTEYPMIEIVDEPDELNGLALMSLCHGGAILGNSTYSWWGAMLGAEEAAAPVVYPPKWFSYANPELFPSRWIPVSA